MQKHITKINILFCSLFFLIPGLLIARDAPITTAGSSNVCPGSAVTIPVTVTNFTLVKAVSLRLDYNPTLLSFANFSNLNPGLAGASINNVSVSASLSKLMIAWTSLTALNLTNGSKLMDLNFTLISGTVTVTFNNTDNSGGDCEYADENGNAMNDLPSANFYFNSTITSLAAATPGTITGNTALCAGTSNVVYSVPPITNATGYIWTVPSGGTIMSGANTATIVVNFSTSAVSGSVTVAGTNTCGTGPVSNLPVTIYPLPVPVISGTSTVCLGSGIIYSTDSGMTNYLWSVIGGNIFSGAGTATVTVIWNTVGLQTVSVSFTNTNLCTAAAPGVKSVTVNPQPVPTITGNGSPCIGEPGLTYTTEPGMTGYTWTISAGGTITSGTGTNAIMVNWNSAGNQTLSVNYFNGYGCTASTATFKSITVEPLPSAAGIITGTGNVCAGSNGVVYSTSVIPNATYYGWTLPQGALIAAGAGTNVITVNFNPDAVSGNISVIGSNMCGWGIPSPYFPINVNPLPAAAGTITGLPSICTGATGVPYSIPVISNATGYSWTVPQGSYISSGANTNQVQINFGAAPMSGIITVQGSNLCGNGQASPDFNVIIGNLPAPSINVFGPVLTSSAAIGNQWFYEETGAIPGATGQVYTAIKTGWYWVSVNIYGCQTDTSNHVYVLFDGESEINGSGSINLFPVPNDGRFTISLTGMEHESCILQIYNQLGIQIFSLQDIIFNGSLEKNIDLGNVSPGIYTVQIVSRSHKIVRKVLITK